MLRTKLIYLALLVSITLIAGCDNHDKTAVTATPSADHNKPAAKNEAFHQQQTKLVHLSPKITFDLPDAFVEQQESSDITKIFIDPKQQYILMAIVLPNPDKTNEQNQTELNHILDTLETLFTTQDPNLKILNKEISKIHNFNIASLAAITDLDNQSSYTYTAIANIMNQQIHLQFTAPVNQQQDIQKIISQTLNSIKLIS